MVTDQFRNVINMYYRVLNDTKIQEKHFAKAAHSSALVYKHCQFKRLYCTDVSIDQQGEALKLFAC